MRPRPQAEGVRANAQTLLIWIADRILDYTPPPRTEEYRAAIRALPTDAERLLRAIGEAPLRRQLPPSLLAMLLQDASQLGGVELAEAAIATYHTGALKQYRRAIEASGPAAAMGRSARAVDSSITAGFSGRVGASGTNAGRPSSRSRDRTRCRNFTTIRR